VNVDQRELMLEVIEQSIAEERKDEKIASLEKHDGIWMKGESETEPEVAVEKVLKLLVWGQNGGVSKVSLRTRQFDCLSTEICCEASSSNSIIISSHLYHKATWSSVSSKYEVLPPPLC
jgi:hypothetical protein